MTDMVPFVYGDQQVRTVLVDGEPWFVAADVCAVLGLANVGNALARLDDDQKSSIHLTDGTPGNPNRAVVSESGLYDLILRSDKPDARAIRRWVTHEVLPALGRTGMYAVERRDVDQLDVLRGMIDQLVEARDTARRAELAATGAAQAATETSARLDAIEGRHEWFAALGYARLHDLPTSAIYLQRLGTEAGRVGRKHGVTPNKVEHALYGRVNQWPAWVWSEAVENRSANDED